ncbi:hypothetical protein [Chroococcidiopsis thermalis]|uniref:hypothetical protein n=1 Tax=Chroococcidiopsis thermalis TaxID=54299 RepID=UPI0002E4A2CB|nr:hypothetical protein [Chroococcidiopsis thermalis]
MLKTKFTTSNSIGSVEPDQWLNKSLVLSSKHLGWNEILVQQYQSFPTSTEVEIPALSNHWLNLPLGQPIHLTQKRDNAKHESIVQKGDCIFVPAGQPSYWHCGESVSYKSMLHIYLKPESIAQVVETSELESDRVNLVNCFSKTDLQLQQIAIEIYHWLKLPKSSILAPLILLVCSNALQVFLRISMRSNSEWSGQKCCCQKRIWRSPTLPYK